MRAVTGTVVSSKPISLSKASKVLSRFAANENAARPEVLAYVRRASAAFDELVQFHREIRAAGKRPHIEEPAEEERKKKRKRSSDDQVADQDGAAAARDDGEIRAKTNLADGNMNLQGGGAEVESDGQRKKKKKRKVDDEKRSELAVSGDRNAMSVGKLVEKVKDYGDGAEFGEIEKKRKKKKDKRKEEGIVEVLEQKHKTDSDPREELEQPKDQKEQRKKKKKKTDRRED